MIKITVITFLMITILIFGLTKVSLAQDPIFSQPFSTAMYQNPALTGFSDYARIQAAQRAQWVSLPSSFYTTYLGLDISSKNNRWGFGLSFLNDLASETLSTFSPNFNLAYRIKFNENAALRIGLGFGLVMRSINWENLTFGDQIDPHSGFIYATSVEPPPSTSMNFGNLHSGIFFHNRYIFAGYSAHNWTEPNQSFFPEKTSKLPIRHTFALGFNLYNSDNLEFSIKPSVQYMIQQDFTRIRIGSAFHYKAYLFGVYSSLNDIFVSSIGFTKKRFQIRYSHDLLTSLLTSKRASAHEITVGLLVGKGKDNSVDNKWLQPLF